MTAINLPPTAAGTGRLARARRLHPQTVHSQSRCTLHSPPPDQPTDAPPGLSDILGTTFKYTGKSKFDYLVEVDSEQVVRNLTPDFALLKTLTTRGIMVTSVATTSGYDFVSRFFAPAVGIDEDPVTGSAHSCLGPYWSTRLGKQELVAYQASERGGIVRVRVAADRVYIGGRATTVLRGELVDS